MTVGPGVLERFRSAIDAARRAVFRREQPMGAETGVMKLQGAYRNSRILKLEHF